MSEASFTRKRGAPFRMSEERRAELRKIQEPEAFAGAQADADNPPIGAVRLAKMVVAREVRRIREATGMSQADFAARFRISLGRLRDYEQARSEPGVPELVFLRLIAEHRDIAEQVLQSLEAEGLSPEYA